MKLFHAAASPFVRKVVVLLHETGQLSDVEIVDAAGTPVNSANMPTTYNPLGKIPTLALSDGKTLFDSRVICRFLNDRGNGKLYPDAPELWATLTLEALGDGIMDAAVLMVYERRCRPEEMVITEWIDGQWVKIVRALDAVENDWMDQLAGPLDMGQIAIGCALAYLDFRHGERDWRAGRQNLAVWEAEFAKRESMVVTVPVG